jgi:hypothetical protein
MGLSKSAPLPGFYFNHKLERLAILAQQTNLLVQVCFHLTTLDVYYLSNDTPKLIDTNNLLNNVLTGKYFMMRILNIEISSLMTTIYIGLSSRFY